MSSQSVSGTNTLSTSGDDNSFARVTVNGTLFNPATSTSSYALTSGLYASGAVNDSFSMPVAGECLTGEGTYAGVIVSYSGNALQQRTVTASAIDLGLQHALASLGSVGGTTTLTSLGADTNRDFLNLVRSIRRTPCSKSTSSRVSFNASRILRPVEASRPNSVR